ncbi:DUF417 family protein [Cyclobacterium qasimii]|uniref:Membrane protein n=2 Tax=Cyclobacterium qasimii TaxID=1350429 RepID=S7V7Y7_9BACT|nr:DUF417 family protein [Cyclobacterium qasimii]EPR66380.1 membrane protein [Cyclobacterium qasimii M12-11B]GEO21152.1 membrane protein [Cyclobacterium qasimii]
MHNKISTIGYNIGVFGTALILIWIGLFKFTPTEATAIKPLVENHFAMNWLYSFLSLQAVSNLIGLSEIVIGALLFGSLFWPQLGKIAGIGSAVIFITTLSFLITTPGVWKLVDGFPITDFFLIKDIPYLAISLMVWGKYSNAKVDTEL